MRDRGDRDGVDPGPGVGDDASGDPDRFIRARCLGGEADLRTATAFSWHGQALDDAFTASLNERDALTRDERIEWERQA
ncbi:hypothetical protein AB0C06_29465 [Micromonospora inaquosa]|uniref:hypothetical protein n=1 Tax=Micromonospora inaquosa TaxID=2203716 RepID=UPI003404205D